MSGWVCVCVWKHLCVGACMRVCVCGCVCGACVLRVCMCACVGSYVCG